MQEVLDKPSVIVVCFMLSSLTYSQLFFRRLGEAIVDIEPFSLSEALAQVGKNDTGDNTHNLFDDSAALGRYLLQLCGFVGRPSGWRSNLGANLRKKAARGVELGIEIAERQRLNFAQTCGCELSPSKLGGRGEEV